MLRTDNECVCASACVRVNEAQQAFNMFTLELTMCAFHIVQMRTSSIETFLFRRNSKVLCQHRDDGEDFYLLSLCDGHTHISYWQEMYRHIRLLMLTADTEMD